MTLVRSTSLKVVSIAPCAVAFTMRSAIRARSRVIGTRCSCARRSAGAGNHEFRCRVARRHVFVTVTLEIGHHVGFRNPAVLAAADDDRRIEVVFIEQAAHGRDSVCVRLSERGCCDRLDLGGCLRQPARLVGAAAGTRLRPPPATPADRRW